MIHVCMFAYHIYVCVYDVAGRVKQEKKKTPRTNKIHDSRSYIKILYC